MKAEKIENWCFPPTEPTEDKKRELAARVAKIGVRVIIYSRISSTNLEESSTDRAVEGQ